MSSKKSANRDEKENVDDSATHIDLIDALSDLSSRPSPSFRNAVKSSQQSSSSSLSSPSPREIDLIDLTTSPSSFPPLPVSSASSSSSSTSPASSASASNINPRTGQPRRAGGRGSGRSSIAGGRTSTRGRSTSASTTAIAAATAGGRPPPSPSLARESRGRRMQQAQRASQAQASYPSWDRRSLTGDIPSPPWRRLGQAWQTQPQWEEEQWEDDEHLLDEQSHRHQRHQHQGLRQHHHHHHPNQGPNVDDMSYEQLLALGDQIGKVNTGLSENFINSGVLPAQLYADVQHLMEANDKTCCICQEEFESNDMLRTLICMHRFHSVCIDRWLKDSSQCPICKTCNRME